MLMLRLLSLFLNYMGHASNSLLISLFFLLSDTRYGLHRFGGNDVRVNHRAAAVAVGGDDLLLQKDLCGR